MPAPQAAGRVGEVVGVQVIPRPHEDLGAILPLAGKKERVAAARVAARQSNDKHSTGR